MKTRLMILTTLLAVATTVVGQNPYLDNIKKAEAGDAEAQVQVGYAYRKGEGVDKDLKKAAFWYRKAADQGDKEGQYYLGCCYEEGIGVEKDDVQAFYWFKKSAEQGYADAEYGLGLCYSEGWGVAKDMNQAVYWYRRAAEHGDRRGQANLGYCYYEGQGVVKDDKLAFYWNKKSADQGLARAQTWIGYLYECGKGVEQNYTEALNWYVRAAAQGDGDALRNAGIFYDEGKGVSKDPGKALFYFREALARGGLSQERTEWTKNRAKALTDSGYTATADEALRQASGRICDQQRYDQNIAAANQGDANALYQVSQSFCGEDEMFAWMRKAAENGHEDALLILIQIYKGALKNYRQYANQEEFKRFMEIGYKHAQEGKLNVRGLTMLGINYNTNKEIKDDKKALWLYRKAVEHPHPDYIGWLAAAEGMLGTCYMNGEEVEQDDEQAFYWFKKSVSHGIDGELDGVMQWRLGKCYYNGEGTKQDNDQALYWFEKALANDCKLAKPWLEKAKKKKQELLLAQTKQKTAPVEEKLPALPTKGAMTNVDENIPRNSVQDTRTYAVIIGNELYENEAEVPFAENDAKVFKDYVQQTLGVPENHIRFIANAGLNRIRGAVRWLKDAMEAQSGQGKIILYYAGHGIPDEANKDAYLLPVDGIGSDVESAYPLNRLYKELSALPAERVTVFLDACFSGAKREGDMMASARGVAIKVKETAPQGKMIVFTAAQGDETAYPFKSQKHGMFTYYLLKKLQETQGNATLGELSDYLATEVKRQSFVENNKVQTPTIVPSAGLQNTWRGLSLK